MTTTTTQTTETTETTATAPGGWSIYHRSEAGAPEVHRDGEWYYQPDDWDAGDVYSEGYATRAEALRACEAEIVQKSIEESEHDPIVIDAEMRGHDR